MDCAKLLDSLINGVLNISLFGDITRDTEDAFLQVSMQCLHPFDVHVGHSN